MKFYYLTLTIINALATGAQLALHNFGWAAFSGFFAVYCAFGVYRSTK